MESVAVFGLCCSFLPVTPAVQLLNAILLLLASNSFNLIIPMVTSTVCLLCGSRFVLAHSGLDGHPGICPLFAVFISF